MLAFLSQFWGWLSAIPGLLTAVWAAIKDGLLVLSGVLLENDRETREQNAATIKQLSDSLAVGNDINSMSKSEITAALDKRGQLRDVPSVPPEGKP